MAKLKNYIVREFTVMSRKDYNELLVVDGEFLYKTYIARLFKNGDVKVNDKLYKNKKFNELYTINLY